MIRTKIKCELCGQEISKSNYTKHLRRHENHPETFETPKYRVNHEGLECQFCGKECKNANSLRNHERLCKQNPNRQFPNGIEGFNNKGRTAWNKGLTAETSEIVKRRSILIKSKYENGELIGSFRGKRHSEETKNKISKSRINYLTEHPEKVPYVINHSSKESYPETYFKDFFNSRNIPFTYHYRINRYELDFALCDIKLDIEIDGDQHYLDKRMIASDIRRDKYLKELGWRTFRIRWSSWKASETYRIQIINELNNILDE